MERTKSISIVSLILITFILITFITALLFVSPENRSQFYWFSLVVVLFCEIITVLGYMKIRIQSNDVNSDGGIILSTTMLTLITLYDAIAIFLILLLWIGLKIDFKSYVSFHLLALGIVFIIGLGLKELVINGIGFRSSFEERKRNNWLNFSERVETVGRDLTLKEGLYNQTEIVQTFMKFYEATRYSDPISNRAVRETEELMAEHIMNLEEKVRINHNLEITEISKLVRELSDLLERRNKILALTKKDMR